MTRLTAFLGLKKCSQSEHNCKDDRPVASLKSMASPSSQINVCLYFLPHIIAAKNIFTVQNLRDGETERHTFVRRNTRKKYVFNYATVTME